MPTPAINLNTSPPIKLVVGLANPGKEYAFTRHNAGAWVLEALAQSANTSFHPQPKFHGLYAKSISPLVYHLLIPSTYMNKSGIAVRACMQFHKIASHEVMIVHDELDLAPGSVRLKFSGSDGGHNGLKDIISHLHTQDFWRLRIGIGRPTRETVDYVLGKPSISDQVAIDQVIETVIQTSAFWLQGQMQKATLDLHRLAGE